MQQDDLNTLLQQLIDGWECELVEFKNVGNSYPTSDIGKYVSALANEANLRNVACAWLVFGIDNKSRQVLGSEYRVEPGRLQGLKHDISQNAEPSLTFRNIYEVQHAAGRVIMFEVPAAPQGMPIAYNSLYYARAGESLVGLSLDKLDEIRQQTAQSDWSAQIVHDATLSDLDQTAIQHARQAFAQKHANRFGPEEVAKWSDAAFLDRAKITADGQMTRATLLLLGRAESSFRLTPHPAQLTWKLEGEERAYEHFSPPLLLSTTNLYKRIRNIQIRILPEDALLPVEVAKYDQAVVLEALHNCIAHQDYTANGRVVVTEHTDRLVFENLGGFFDGDLEDYIIHHRSPLRYRNPFLTQAMVNLNMIDTMGYGISRMFQEQRRRFFPMPDYDFSDPEKVRMTLHGRVIDPAYSRLLIEKTDLALPEILALDRIQKHLPAEDAVVKRLRRAGLIEGRKPNLYVCASIAGAAEAKAEYIRTRPQDDAFYKKLVLDFLDQYSSASRKEIDSLLMGKLSEGLTTDQKHRKVGNLLTAMRRSGQIHNSGSKRAPKWVRADTNTNKAGPSAE